LNINGGTFTGASTYDITLSDADMTVTQASGVMTCRDYLHTLGTHTLAGTINARNFSQTGGTFTNSGASSINASGDVVITGTFNNPINNTLTMTGASNTLNASVTIGNLIINGTSISMSTNNLTLGGNFTCSGGTFDANDLTFSIQGNTLINGGTLKTGTNIVTFGTDGADTVTISSGTLEIESNNTATGIIKNAAWTNSGGTIIYDAAGVVNTDILSSISNYNNLEINSAGSTYTLDGNIVVGGNFSITSGTVDVSASDYGITIGGDFTRTGTFTQQQGAVTFNNAAQISHVYGSTTFYDLICTTAGKEMQFAAGSTQTITNLLSLTGITGNLVKLRSTASGTQWNINPNDTTNVSFVDVKDSRNQNGSTINPPSSTDSGNNTNWFNTPSPQPQPRPPEPPEPPIPPVTDPNGPPGGSPSTPARQDANINSVTYEGQKYDKRYASGKYRTVVIVFEGKVLVSPYDDKGPKYEEGQMLTPGQQTSREAQI